MEELMTGWYNFRTGSYDYPTKPPDDYSDYLEEGTERNLYRAYVASGVAPADAFVKVVHLVIREE